MFGISYLATFLCKNRPNLGKCTSPMDPMGKTRLGRVYMVYHGITCIIIVEEHHIDEWCSMRTVVCYNMCINMISGQFIINP